MVSGTRATAADVNEDFQDVGDALTDSLPRDGQAGMTGQFQSIDGTSGAPGISWGSDPSTGIRREGPGDMVMVCSGTDVLEITTAGVTVLGLAQTLVGEVKDYAGASIPNGWFPCDGRAISRVGFAALFTALGTTWGVGNGTTTFNIPDLQGRITAHLDGGAGRLTTAGGGVDGATLGAVGGTQGITLDTTMIPSHTHALTDPGHPHTVAVGSDGASSGTFQRSSNNSNTQSTNSAFTGITIANTGGGLAHKNVQPTAMVNKLIYAGVATV